jgi:hypothetical protein
VTDWGRSRRAALMLVVGPVIIWTAACANSTSTIPSATPSPSAASTTIAPGVTVDSSELALPPYSVSASNPLPTGISAKRVASAVIVDDLIENEALQRADPSLLEYADSGDALESETQEIAANKSGNISVLKIRDAVTSIQLGSKSDPNNAAAQIAAIVEGRETQEQRVGTGAINHATTPFDVLVWLVWSPTQARYLLCDTASA